jgi:putative nucleotidyltransferase with HDIG domain
MVTPVGELSKSGRIYIAVVVLSGTAALTTSIASLVSDPENPRWLVFAALTLLTGSFSIKVPSISARFSVSEAFVFASALSFGPDVATLIVAADAIILTSWPSQKDRVPLRALFNMSAAAAAMWASGRLFVALLPGSTTSAPALDQLLVPVIGLALSYFLVNSALVAVALGVEKRISPLSLWRANFAWLSLNYLGGASLALMLVTYTRSVNLITLSVIIPLVVIIYLTFRTSLGRLEDAKNHVAQLNDLYLSTIETLAMAVDAKDQITHGHIRRVQVYAVQLAKCLGVRDDHQLKALEAAALLHDMGKLAIPEHILNKPGALTRAEFTTMKRHADIGADLLSSVRFPYPVVPIVRYHHEHWDGGGYPSGISGTDIPLGARILSVVDCFDALTSDRPYRPKLSSDEAFDILLERRGSMYDPLVVDTFVRVYSQIAPAAIQAGIEARSLTREWGINMSADNEPSAGMSKVPDEGSPVLTSCRLRISGTSSPAAALSVAAEYLQNLTSATVYALFRYDPTSDSLQCQATVGDSLGLLDRFTIGVGDRVTGWVGANRRTSVNSYAALDLADLAASFTPGLRSTIATPITRNGRLLGVLTAYSSSDHAFSDAHREAFEYLAVSLETVIDVAAGDQALA